MGDSTKDRLYIRIGGITCERCVERITRALETLDGVEAVSLRHDVARISGERLPSAKAVVEAVRAIGYEADEAGTGRDLKSVRRVPRPVTALLIALCLLLAAWGIRLLFGYDVFNAIPAVDGSAGYGMLFVTGLLTGVHCVSMCGAIGIAASSETNSVRSLRRPLLYNAGRVLSYALTGGLAALIGSAFRFSPALRGAVILAAAACMLLMSLSMLGVLRFSLPRLFRFRTGGKAGAFAIGLMNGFMPCGPLQAMQIYAVSTGNFLRGALSMAAFALGTVPLMLLSGAALSFTRGRARAVFGRIAPVLMLLLSLSMLNRGLLALRIDSGRLLPDRNRGYLAAVQGDGVQTVEFELGYDSYADVVVQKGVPVRFVVRADAGKITGCNNEIVSADFGFDLPIAAGENVAEFTPEREGEYVYTCWMNMITNRIRVIDDPEYFEREAAWKIAEE